MQIIFLDGVVTGSIPNLLSFKSFLDKYSDCIITNQASRNIFYNLNLINSIVSNFTSIFEPNKVVEPSDIKNYILIKNGEITVDNEFRSAFGECYNYSTVPLYLLTEDDRFSW